MNEYIQSTSQQLGLNPKWEECLNFRNIDDENVQEKYFEITVMHNQDKLVGTVYIDLSNLLSSRHEALHHGLDAMFPIYHFEKGLRGDLQVKVKL